MPRPSGAQSSFCFLEDPDDANERGRLQLQVIARRFFRQRTQPKWIDLSKSLYKVHKLRLHSSQISGLSSGKLNNPSPKCLLILGQLNLAIANRELPASLKDFWEGLVPMVGPGGQPLGPEELFRVVTGQLDLGIATDREIPEEMEERVSRALGAHLRRRLIEQGEDFIMSMGELRAICLSMEPLLMGRTVQGDQLLEDLARLAAKINEAEVDLWGICADIMSV
jgi:hypothetical protein